RKGKVVHCRAQPPGGDDDPRTALQRSLQFGGNDVEFVPQHGDPGHRAADPVELAAEPVSVGILDLADQQLIADYEKFYGDRSGHKTSWNLFVMGTTS